MELIGAVATNVITGFLGAGKTTAILKLLKSKPRAERWAILVNEFGEVGVDGALLAPPSPSMTGEGGVFVREVPGGCMCCAAGVPMTIALNRLLAKARPHRLIVEPTGLGHPREILEVLTRAQYRSVLQLRATLTLVDARKLQDARYRAHDIFNQQIEVADIVVGNKTDLYRDSDYDHLRSYVHADPSGAREVVFTRYGELNLGLLERPSKYAARRRESGFSLLDSHGHLEPQPDAAALPEFGHLRIDNQGEGYESAGWRFGAALRFDRQRLFGFFSGLEVERAKGAVATTEGAFSYNLHDGMLTEQPLSHCLESRVEIIAQHREARWERELFSCLIR